MCGIAALLRNLTTSLPSESIRNMVSTICHRGPDNEGVVFLSATPDRRWRAHYGDETEWTVALGSRRLSILDISLSGSMPMAYQNKFWIIYNGELYNFIEIRAELKRLGHTFRSTSDTEVFLAAYVEWGGGCFTRFRGMWSCLIFDGIRNEVILCRDRLGIKPLYVWQGPGIVAVASELKQFLHVPGFTARIDLSMAAEYLHTGYEDAQKSFFRDVYPIPAGCWVRIPLNTLVLSTPGSYWYPEQVQVSVRTVMEASQLFAEKLRESIGLHLRSDVPVGCALSGGLDSSAIAALVDAAKDRQDYPLHTFTSVFPGDKTDEQEYVAAVIANIRAVPHVTTPNPVTFLKELDQFLYAHDEPVGSLSIYAGYCVARLTREAGISVTLNGQGCDEILSAYWQSYFLHLQKLARQGQIIPLLRHFTGALMKNGNSALLGQVPAMLRRYYARRKPVAQMHLRNTLVKDTPHILTKILALDEQSWRVEEIRSMFLPRLLKWDDRNSMAFSVEGRYPFLDHELIELCLSFSSEVLYHCGWTKWPLRLGLGTHLPQKIRQRRTKLGFEVPQDKWLCGPLRLVIENWLKQDRPLWEYIDLSEAQRLAQRTWKLRGKVEEPGQALFRLFIFDRWLEIFEVTR